MTNKIILEIRAGAGGDAPEPEAATQPRFGAVLNRPPEADWFTPARNYYDE